MKTLPLFIKIDTGTDYIDRFTINPLFLLLAEATMKNMQIVAELFGIKYSSKKDKR